MQNGSRINNLWIVLKSEIDVSASGAKRPCPVRCRQFYDSEADTTATSATSVQLENENCACSRVRSVCDNGIPLRFSIVSENIKDKMHDLHDDLFISSCNLQRISSQLYHAGQPATSGSMVPQTRHAKQRLQGTPLVLFFWQHDVCH
jgi:hypothetical protein